MRTLLISQFVPFPTRSGTEQRTQLLYRALFELGDVDILLVTEVGGYRPEDGVRERLHRDFGLVGCVEFPRVDDRWPWKALRLFGKAWPARIAKIIQGPSVEFSGHVSVSSAVAGQLKRQQYTLIVSRSLLPYAAARPDSSIPCIVDVDDLPSDIVAKKASQATDSSIRALYWRFLSRRTKRMEARLLSGCRHALAGC